MRAALVIGGGISGLSAAYYLRKAGLACTLVEKRPYLGGVIRTERVEGCLIEGGPDSFLSVKPWAMDLIRDLGLAGEVIGSNDHQRRTWIRKNGRLVALPDGLMMMVPTRVAPMITTRLVGWGAKLRMGLEWFRKPPAAPLPDRSVAEFVRDHYGDEAVDYLAEPLLAGVYGGDPSRLSVASVLPRFVEIETKYGSLTRGSLALMREARAGKQPLFRTLKGGLGQLVDAVVAAARPEVLHGEAEAMERSEAGYRVRVAGEWVEASHVVLACEAHRAAELVGPLDGEIAAALATVDYSSSITASLVFDRSSGGRLPAGFGILVPKRERRRLVACTFVGAKFSHRVPDHLVLVRCFLGGAGQESDEALVATVLEELRDLAGIAARPRFWRIHRWPRSMAQYPVGHLERMAAVDERLKSLPGLHLAGNGYYGIGVPDCVRMGKQAAERIASMVKTGR